jgi:hypothetical protein
MKKILFVIALAASAFGASSTTYADDMHDHRAMRHHHPVCHMYREHGHMVKHCR